MSTALQVQLVLCTELVRYTALYYFSVVSKKGIVLFDALCCNKSKIPSASST